MVVITKILEKMITRFANLLLPHFWKGIDMLVKEFKFFDLDFIIKEGEIAWRQINFSHVF